MRRKIIVGTLSAVIGLQICSLASAQINQDVYVDLSVLDSLGTPETPAVNSVPLFPVVKADKGGVKTAPNKQKAVKVKKAKVATAGKSAKASKISIAGKKIISTKEKNIFAAAPQSVEDTVKAAPVIPVKQQVESEIVAQVEPVEPISPVSPQGAASTDKTDVNRQNAAESVFADNVQEISEPTAAGDEKIVVVDVEPLTHPVQVVEAEPIKSSAADSAFVGRNLETAQNNIETSSSVQADENQDIPVASVVKDSPAPVQQAEKSASLSEVNSQLQFSADVSELTPEQQAQVDKVIAAFEDAHLNKIAIFAFNVDDGVDSFKKKRLSLNRAIEVRSYLLQKGYKNFSIKVVNVDATSEKANTVTIEELK